MFEAKESPHQNTFFCDHAALWIQHGKESTESSCLRHYFAAFCFHSRPGRRAGMTTRQQAYDDAGLFVSLALFWDSTVTDVHSMRCLLTLCTVAVLHSEHRARHHDCVEYRSDIPDHYTFVSILACRFKVYDSLFICFQFHLITGVQYNRSVAPQTLRARICDFFQTPKWLTIQSQVAKKCVQVFDRESLVLSTVTHAHTDSIKALCAGASSIAVSLFRSKCRLHIVKRRIADILQATPPKAPNTRTNRFLLVKSGRERCSCLESGRCNNWRYGTVCFGSVAFSCREGRPFVPEYRTSILPLLIWNSWNFVFDRSDDKFDETVSSSRK